MKLEIEIPFLKHPKEYENQVRVEFLNKIKAEVTKINRTRGLSMYIDTFDIDTFICALVNLANKNKKSLDKRKGL